MGFSYQAVLWVLVHCQDLTKPGRNRSSYPTMVPSIGFKCQAFAKTHLSQLQRKVWFFLDPSCVSKKVFFWTIILTRSMLTSQGHTSSSSCRVMIPTIPPLGKGFLQKFAPPLSTAVRTSWKFDCVAKRKRLQLAAIENAECIWIL